MTKKRLFQLLLVAVVCTSCNQKAETRVAAEKCELFNIGSYLFYNPQVYERPVIFEKGSHALLHEEYIPAWYAAYCAENRPSYFETKEDYLKHIHSKNIDSRGEDYYAEVYEKNKDVHKGFKTVYYDDFHLLFRGTVSIKKQSTGDEYLLVAGKSYIEDESDYDKNTDYYESDVKTMFAYMKEDGVFKSINIDQIMGNFSKEQYDKVLDILNTKTLVNSSCVEIVNTIMTPDFNDSKLPQWVYTKAEMDDY